MISQSQINTYIICSQKYKYKYILSAPASNDTAISSFLVGLIIHGYIDAINKNCDKNSDVDFSALLLKSLSSIKNVWVDNIVTNSIENLYSYLKPNYLREIDEAFNTAKKVCLSLKEEYLGEITGLKTEQKLEYQNIVCYIDAINIDEDFKTLVIKDFKTSKAKKNFRKSIQDLIYVYVIYKNFGVIAKFEYVNIVYTPEGKIKNLEKTLLEYTMKDILDAEEYISNFKKGVEAGVFIKNTASFLCSPDYCEYYDICQRGVV